MRIDDHYISFKHPDLRISLKTNETLFYLNTHKPLLGKLYGKVKVFITLDESEWDPNYMSHA